MDERGGSMSAQWMPRREEPRPGTGLFGARAGGRAYWPLQVWTSVISTEISLPLGAV